MTERERVREQIEGIVEHWQGISREHPNPIDMHFCVEEILAIDGLEVRADDQVLPRMCRISMHSPTHCVQDMLKAGFVRVIK